jgi:hypothetical protein
MSTGTGTAYCITAASNQDSTFLSDTTTGNTAVSDGSIRTTTANTYSSASPGTGP